MVPTRIAESPEIFTPSPSPTLLCFCGFCWLLMCMKAIVLHSFTVSAVSICNCHYPRQLPPPGNAHTKNALYIFRVFARRRDCLPPPSPRPALGWLVVSAELHGLPSDLFRWQRQPTPSAAQFGRHPEGEVVPFISGAPFFPSHLLFTTDASFLCMIA
eukprot:RCo026536